MIHSILDAHLLKLIQRVEQTSGQVVKPRLCTLRMVVYIVEPDDVLFRFVGEGYLILDYVESYLRDWVQVDYLFPAVRGNFHSSLFVPFYAHNPLSLFKIISTSELFQNLNDQLRKAEIL